MYKRGEETLILPQEFNILGISAVLRSKQGLSLLPKLRHIGEIKEIELSYFLSEGGRENGPGSVKEIRAIKCFISF